MGGLDIYNVQINQDGMPAGVPENTGAPMNSTSDDFGIVFFSDGRTGLLSSNRYSEGRNDNIYAFSIHKPQKQIFSLLVKDSATSAMLSAVLTLEDTAGGQNDQFISLSGTFSLPLFAGEDYVFHVNSEGYKPASGIRLTAPINPDEQMEIRLVQNDFFIEGTIYFQADDGTIAPLDSAIVIITNISGDTVCSNFYFTDVHGKYESCLLKPGGQYFVTAYREGYFTKSTFTVDLSPGGNVQDIYTNRIVIGKAITINNVYFDLDKWNIRPDAAVGLDYVVTLLNENPDIIIELSSHTDCRADDDYNMALSDRRAKACADYIVGRGVVRERITGRGYGESRLLNHCNCDGRRKSDCTEEDHALNRRTEFKVTGFLKSGREVELESNL
jgi:outer membrane protein OmpA-like peptidoglycan-associated protein